MLVSTEQLKFCEFDNSYSRLPSQFFARLSPTVVANPNLVKFNLGLARELGIDPSILTPEEWVSIFSGNQIPEGSDPLAMAYAGHQFGHFVPQLGDGRAILIGEVKDASGIHRDIQLKGSGQTPFSRQGDGRAALGPVLREFIISEAMHSLGIPSTRALAAVTTGEPVYRETALPGAILTRVALGYVRVGTFEYFAVRRDTGAVKQLADYVIARHHPETKRTENPYAALLQSVAEKQADLVAQWMCVGFIHGVMNTDNMSISGETIDFGPCAFVDTYDPNTVFSSIDNFGRYAYGNQPKIAQWNLMQLAESLLPLIDASTDQAVKIARRILESFPELYKESWLEKMRKKLGFITPQSEDTALIDELLSLMEKNSADLTLTFRGLCYELEPNTQLKKPVRNLFSDPTSFDSWVRRWHSRISEETLSRADIAEKMLRHNPAVIPRNHLVENALEAAIDDGNLELFDQLSEILSSPYREQPEESEYTKPPEPGETAYQTFCGT